MTVPRIVLLLVAGPLLAQETLPGTSRLTMTGDLAGARIDGIHRFVDRETAAAPENRARYWHRDYMSSEAYQKSVAANRERLRTIIGAVDARAGFDAISLLADTDGGSVIARGTGYRIHAVRWPVFEGVWVEGLMLEPDGVPVARIVALPDADWSPEIFVGLESGIPAAAQVARRLAENGCLVLIPTIIDRKDTWSGIPGIRMTNSLTASGFTGWRSDVLALDYPTAKKRLGDREVIVPDPTPGEVSRMMARHRAQLSELLTRYGTIDMLCLDMWFGPNVWPQLRETVLHLRQLQPDVMLRARGSGHYGDYYTPEGFAPGDKGNTNAPWFVIYPLGSSFSYERVAENHKGAAWVVRNLIDSVAKGSNFMVGIGPDGNGRFHPTAVSQLKEAGEWLKVNGSGIYATRARDGELWSEGADIRFTRTKDKRTVYAFALKWPGEMLALRSVLPAEGSTNRMLGAGEPLKWTPQASGVEIQLPPGLQDESRPAALPGALRFGRRPLDRQRPRRHGK